MVIYINYNNDKVSETNYQDLRSILSEILRRVIIIIPGILRTIVLIFVRLISVFWPMHSSFFYVCRYIFLIHCLGF